MVVAMPVNRPHTYPLITRTRSDETTPHSRAPCTSQLKTTRFELMILMQGGGGGGRGRVGVCGDALLRRPSRDMTRTINESEAAGMRSAWREVRGHAPLFRQCQSACATRAKALFANWPACASRLARQEHFGAARVLTAVCVPSLRQAFYVALC
jgi:hypothetical protein